MHLSYDEILKLLINKVPLEYYDPDCDFWWTLTKYEPIKIIFEYDVRIKKN